MDSAVEENCGLGILAPASPNMYTCEGSPLDRSARSDDLGIPREACLKIIQELDMVGITVVRCEPSLAWD